MMSDEQKKRDEEGSGTRAGTDTKERKTSLILVIGCRFFIVLAKLFPFFVTVTDLSLFGLAIIIKLGSEGQARLNRGGLLSWRRGQNERNPLFSRDDLFKKRVFKMAKLWGSCELHEVLWIFKLFDFIL